MSIGVLIVDDHTLVRQMLAGQLGGMDGVTVLGTAAHAQDGLEQAQDLAPDVVLMDIDMPGLICFDAARRIRKSVGSKVIFLSAFTHDHYIDQALKVEAEGYLTKTEPLEVLWEAIRTVASGRSFYSPEVFDRIIIDDREPRLVSKGKTRASTLTPREVEVLRYLARGMTRKEVAQLIHVSPKTVERHTDNIMRKLDIHDRVELARFAMREGLAEA